MGRFRPRYFRRFRPRIKAKDVFEEKYPRNFNIKAETVRVLDENGKNLGIFILSEAVRLARERELDLVLLVPHANPPVCKLVNWESFKYQMQKKEKEQKKKHKAVKVKEVKFNPKIAQGDFERKVNDIKRFLQKGHQVKVTVVRRRRVTNEMIDEFKERLLTMLEPYSTILNTQNRGRNLYILIKPKENAKAKDQKNSSQEAKD